MINKNAQALIDDLENNRLPEFNMGMEFIYETPQCIAGHAASRMGKGSMFNPGEVYVFLGLNCYVGTALCYIDYGHNSRKFSFIWNHLPDDLSIAQITQPQAAEALRKACELS